MAKMVVRRLLWGIPSLFIVTFLVFALLDLAPGDAARSIAGPEASEETVQGIRDSLKLGDPLLIRYGRWIGDAATGDLGVSLVGRQSVARMVFDSIPATMSLVGVAMAISLVGALALGLAPARWPHRSVDRVCTSLTAVSVSMPSMWIAMILLTLFALDRTWLPAVGYTGLLDNPWEWLRHLLLPAFALAASTAGELARQLRGSMRDEMDKDYVLAAQARGVRRGRVVRKHALKNAAIPLVTVLGLRIGQLLGGTVIVEQIFVIDGMGRLTVTAVLARDVPVVLGVVVVATTIVLLLSLLVDASYGYFNPKLRTS